MNKKQCRTWGNEREGKKIKMMHHLPFFFSLLMVLGCQNPFDAPVREESVASWQGYFSLASGEKSGRTILPESEQNFAAYTLEFFAGSHFQQVDRTSTNLSEPVALGEGTWDLYVTAYMDTNKTKPAAQGELKGIVIKANETTTGKITLEPIDDGKAEGTFSWKIGYPSNVSEALMVITRLPVSVTESPRTIYFTGAGMSPIGSDKLNTGYYRVVFKLNTVEGLEVERWEILHVYQNMESTFEYTFTESQTTQRYNIGVNAGTGGQIETDPFGIAPVGTSVTVYAKPDHGYQLASLSISANGNAVSYQSVTGAGPAVAYSYTFTMPASDVAINVTFKEITIDGNLWGFIYGVQEDGISLNYTQAVWQLSESNVTAAKTAGAKLVLELSKAPTSGMQLVWQGPENNLWWQGEKKILGDSGEAISGTGAVWDAVTNMLTITLAEVFDNYASLLDQPDLNIVIAYYGGSSVNDLGIVSANLIANTVPAPINGNLGNYRFGIVDDIGTINYQQAVWELSSANVTAAKTMGAKLVLVLSQAPVATMQLVWQGPDNNLWWNQSDILGELGDVNDGTGSVWDAGTNTLTINLTEAFADSYSTFIDQSSINLVIAYYGGNNVNDLGIVSANLVGGSYGSANITITFAGITDSAPLIVDQSISRSGANGPKTATLRADNPTQYTGIEWYVSGTTVSGTGAEFILDSANAAYNSIGEHFLTVEVLKDGKPYNKTITFTVTD
jgi:hypothetical protein